jgi:hypothetical protein
MRLLTGLCACTHVERAGFDNPTRSVRYCGNKHASESDVLAEARHECSAKRELEVIRCMREQVGEQADTYRAGFGLTVTSVNATYGTCCDFTLYRYRATLGPSRARRVDWARQLPVPLDVEACGGLCRSSSSRGASHSLTELFTSRRHQTAAERRLLAAAKTGSAAPPQYTHRLRCLQRYSLCMFRVDAPSVRIQC